MTAAITNLRAIAADLVERAHPLAPWFAAALAEYEASAPHGLELGEAFGLALAPGAVPWWALERRQQRDELLREITCRHFPTLSTRAAAAEIADRIDRYQAGNWRRDRVLMSPATVDPLRIRLHRLLKLGQPIGLSTIRRAVAQMVPLRLSHEACDALAPKETHHKCEPYP